MDKIYMASIILVLLFCCNTSKEASLVKQTPNNNIRINQIGYYAQGPKQATVVNSESIKTFSIIDTNTKKSVFDGQLGNQKTYPLAGETVQLIDFTNFNKQGVYYIQLSNGWTSYPFRIATSIYNDALVASVKSFYFQRASMDLEEQYAGKWHRSARQVDNEILYHPSIGKEGSISSPKGWYDAGDYGRYVVNGAFSAGQLLMAYERHSDFFSDNTLNINESGNGISDLLDEIKYEADWILTMQDPNDGGVYNKLTTKKFSGVIMPADNNMPHYILPKGTAAALDFAAFMAKLSRIYARIDEAQSRIWLTASERAWQWALKNPDTPFTNPKDVSTGEYGDKFFHQEKYWAAAELYLATEQEEYFTYLQSNAPDLNYIQGDGWQSYMRFIAAFALLQDNSPYPDFEKQKLKKMLLFSADNLVDIATSNDYNQCVNKFAWGSNSDVQNTAVILAEAYRHQPKPEYLQIVVSSMDYLMGHNATGYSYFTGFGSRPAMNIHHRPSQADNIKEPVPGFVVGGPNVSMQDKRDVDYPDNPRPMQAYMDVWPSYASNEICLNWNSPTPYLFAFLEDKMGGMIEK